MEGTWLIAQVPEIKIPQLSCSESPIVEDSDIDGLVKHVWKEGGVRVV
jgi:hypothetical protein